MAHPYCPNSVCSFYGVELTNPEKQGKDTRCDECGWYLYLNQDIAFVWTLCLFADVMYTRSQADDDNPLPV